MEFIGAAIRCLLMLMGFLSCIVVVLLFFVPFPKQWETEPEKLIVRDPSMDDDDLAKAVLDMDGTQGQKAIMEVVARYQADMIQSVDDPDCDAVSLKERLATLRGLIIVIDQWADEGKKLRLAASGEEG